MAGSSPGNARWRTLRAFVDRRRLLALAGLVLWALVIAGGAGRRADDDAWLALPGLGPAVVSIVVALMVIGFLLLIGSAFAFRRGENELPERRPLWPTLVVVALLLLVAFNFDPGTDRDDALREVPTPVEEEAEVVSNRARLGEGEAAALLALIGGALAVVIWTRRRLRAADPDDGASSADEFDLEPVLAEARRELELGSDPRSSVIAAYAGMEAALDRLGWGRSSTETPTEFTRRILGRFDLDGRPVVELAALYEVARFSDRAISAAEQERAAIALAEIEADLADHDHVSPGGDR